MTRKDYELIAAATRDALHSARPWSEDKEEGIRLTARSIADALAADNPRFDRSRFLAACGVAPSPATTGAEG